ncbi:MAG TPA: polymer-forming cytoskeletal protein [Verrucomicrobiae bacterium]|nr:polymer-forming cytoskeletal protein [Verrucomicrobiae bacterium]
MKPDKINVACPHCGHVQLEPRDGYSTVCKKCRQHFRLEEVLRPRTDREVRHHDTRQVTCFQCGTLLAVAAEAESTMCKRCSAHIDLRNYTINQAVSKNFRTHGTFVIGEKGYVFNTEAEVGDAIIKGRFLGKLHAHRTLTIHAPADFKGTFKAGLLLIPAGVKMAWPKPLDVQSVEIAGELVANVRIPGPVVLRATGHLFGDVEATSLMVEPGAVLVGQLKINPPRATAPNAAADVVSAAPPESPPSSAGATNELPGLDLKPRKPAARRPSSRTKKTG